MQVRPDCLHEKCKRQQAPLTSAQSRPQRAKLHKHLRHLLAVGLGVEGRLREQHGVLLGRHAQLIVEGVVPDLLHVVPVGHDPVLDGVLEAQDALHRAGVSDL